MKRLLVDQRNITKVRMDEADPAPLSNGQIRLRLQSFALTANNITYALSGFDLGYWAFFPSGVEGQGLVPVWGTAEIVESRCEGQTPGQMLYGFFPFAEELVITADVDAQGVVTDAAPHRAALPGVYNRYSPVAGGNTSQDHLRALLQPLLATSYLLSDWLTDNKMFGAAQIIVGSASSKTGLGLCKFLAEDPERQIKIIGLTSKRNKDFVAGLGACDQVFTYDEIAQIARVPSVYVDMAGNGDVKTQLHAHLDDMLNHSAAVGISHWDQFQPKLSLAGPKPAFFFAPAQIAKRRKEWGAGVIEKQISAACRRLITDAQTWMDIRIHNGLDDVVRVYDEVAAGQSDPRVGHVICP